MVKPYPAIADLIPHAPPMVLLDSLDHWTPDQAVCSMTIRPQSPFVVNGQVDSIVSIEYMGQAIAACLGHQAFVSGDGVRVGMIVGCREFRIETAELSVGDELVVTARRLRGDEDISRFECDVLRGEEMISSANVTVFHPKNLALDPNEAQ